MKVVKSIALAAVSAVALMAFVGVTPASASWFVYDAETTELRATPSSAHQYALNFGAFECGGPILTGVAAEAKTVTELNPMAGSNSTCYIFGNAPMKMNECKITAHAGSGGPPSIGTIAIGPAGCGPITITASSCQVSIPAQSGIPATYANKGSGNTAAVEVTVATDELAYTEQGALCSKEGALKGSWYGKWMLKAFNSIGAQRGIQVAATIPAGLFVAGEESGEPSKQPRFNPEVSGEKVVGDANAVDWFATEGGTIGCAQIEASFGPLSQPTAELDSATLEYSGCKMFGLNATVDPNNCFHVLELANADPPYSGSTGVECLGTGESIEIATTFLGSPVCTVSISGQAATTGTTFTNVGSGAERAVDAQATGTGGIAYSVSGGGGSCGQVGSHNDGAFRGTMTLHGVQ